MKESKAAKSARDKRKQLSVEIFYNEKAMSKILEYMELRDLIRLRKTYKFFREDKLNYFQTVTQIRFANNMNFRDLLALIKGFRNVRIIEFVPCSYKISHMEIRKVIQQMPQPIEALLFRDQSYIDFGKLFQSVQMRSGGEISSSTASLPEVNAIDCRRLYSLRIQNYFSTTINDYSLGILLE